MNRRYTLLFLAVLLLQAAATRAQGLIIYMNDADSTVVQLLAEEIESIYSENPMEGVEAVDMGWDGCKWAACNLGAATPEDVGYSCAWGVTEPSPTVAKNSVGDATYPYRDRNTGAYTELGMDISRTQYDIAYILSGGAWRLPTYDDFLQLILNTKAEEVTLSNGLKGVRLTSNRNGRVLTLPVKPAYWYWTATRYGSASQTGSDAYAYNTAWMALSNCTRYTLNMIRPVRD